VHPSLVVCRRVIIWVDANPKELDVVVDIFVYVATWIIIKMVDCAYFTDFSK